PVLSGHSSLIFPPTGAFARARREMARSRYDANGDGICDSDRCANVLFIHPTTPPEINTVPIIASELSALGIRLITRELDTGTVYTTVSTVKNLVPISIQKGLTPDYPDPFGIARSLHSSGISCENQINVSE